MGTPEFAAVSLSALLERGFDVVGVVTQPDREQGRGRKLVAPPVKQLAEAANLPLRQPRRVRAKTFQSWLAELAPELIVVAAYGKILPSAILALPRLGCVNVHGSLLPKYRGAAPIQWALINGESESGVTIMLMDEGMDTGPMLARRATALTQDETAGELHDRLAKLGASLLVETLPSWIRGELTPQRQDDALATMAPMLCKADGLVDWTQDANTICRRIRGVTPWPGGFTTVAGEVVKLLRVSVLEVPPGNEQPGTVIASRDGLWIRCGEGVLALDEVQRQGKRRMTAAEMLRGLPIEPGRRLGQE